jgi:predicted phosphodiesterase
MGPANHRGGRFSLAIVVTAVAVVVLSLTTYVYVSNDSDASVKGGVVIRETDDQLTIRCLSPEVVVRLNGFHGLVEFMNCFRDAQVHGLDGAVTSHNATLIGHVAEGTRELSLVAPQKSSFKFAVMGDSQGKNDMLAQIIASADDCEFMLHCGDITPSSRSSEFAAASEAINASDVPIMITPGNHDAREGNRTEYIEWFGPTEYSFTYSGITFAFVDSSDLAISEQEIEWLRTAFGGADRKVIVTHATSYDPFTGNHTLDPSSCDRLQRFASEEGVTAVFSGHVHAYYLLTVDGTDFMITGGAGGTLTSGVHHYVEASVSAGNPRFSYQKIDITTEVSQLPYVSLKGRAGQTMNITFEELGAMQTVTGGSSYENLYGNVNANGTYSGPRISALLDLVGGMVDGDTLRISSSDGYSQEFGFLNAYPDSEWLGIQGDMVLAIAYNNQAVSGWAEGPRVAFIPADGLYSNLDCEQTSYPGQGWSEYPSAGARWVKNVSTIEVVSGT